MSTVLLLLLCSADAQDVFAPWAWSQVIADNTNRIDSLTSIGYKWSPAASLHAVRSRRIQANWAPGEDGVTMAVAVAEGAEDDVRGAIVGEFRLECGTVGTEWTQQIDDKTSLDFALLLALLPSDLPDAIDCELLTLLSEEDPGNVGRAKTVVETVWLRKERSGLRIEPDGNLTVPTGHASDGSLDDELAIPLRGTPANVLGPLEKIDLVRWETEEG
jgi:hypothetical protein